MENSATKGIPPHLSEGIEFWISAAYGGLLNSHVITFRLHDGRCLQGIVRLGEDGYYSFDGSVKKFTTIANLLDHYYTGFLAKSQNT